MMNSSLHPVRRLRLLACVLVAVLAAGCSKEAQKERSLQRARVYFDAGDYEKAKIEYMALVQKGGADVVAFEQLGLIWSLQGAGLQAGRYLAEARRRGSISIPLRLRLAYSFIGRGDAASAREEAQAILKLDPAHGEALMLLANLARTPEELDGVQRLIDSFPDHQAAAFHLASVPLLMRAGQSLDAEDAVSRALKADPKSVVAHHTAGALRLARQDLAGAEQAFKTGSDLAPVRSLERLNLAQFQAQQGRRAEAKALADEVLRQAPDYLPALLLSAQLAGGMKDPAAGLALLDKAFSIHADNLPARLLQSDLLLAKKDPKRAVEVLQRLDQIYGGQPMVRLRLARALIQNADLPGAATVLNGIITTRPDLVEASLLLAEVNLRSGNPAAVVPAMQVLLEKNPKVEAAALYLVQGLEAQRRFEEAVRVQRAILAQRPDNPSYQARLGHLLVQAGQAGEARAAYEKVLELAPGDPAAVTRLVDLDLYEKKPEAALERVTALRELDPSSAFAAFTEGRIHIVRQDWDRAEAALLKTIELDPNHPDAHDQLIRLYATVQKLPEAIQKAEQRLAVDAKDGRALRQIALIRTQQGEFSKAAEAYERLVAAAPAPDAVALNNLATLYADHLDKPDRAYELARQARAVRPSVDAALTPEAKIEAASIADTLAWLAYRRGDFPQAFALVQEAAGQLGDQPEVQAHLGMAAAAMGNTEVARTALAAAVAASADFPIKEEARQRLALLSGDAAAVQSSTELAALALKTPEDPVLQLRLAEAFDREKNFPQAATAYASALERNPSLAAAALRLAELNAGPLKNPSKALDYAKKARALAPGDPRVAGLLGALAQQSGDHAWAYDLLREATQGDAKDAGTLVTLGHAAYSLGRIEEARAAMQESLAALPEPAIAATATQFLQLTATPAPAAAEAEKALQENPRLVPALVIRAAAQVQANDPAAAATFGEILTIHPDFIPAQKELAALLANDPASLARASELALKARKALPDDPDLAETLARLSYHRKDYRYAVQLLSEASRIRPPGAQALYDLGRSQLALGEKEPARDSLTKAVAAGLPETEAAEAASVLKSLKN